MVNQVQDQYVKYQVRLNKVHKVHKVHKVNKANKINKVNKELKRHTLKFRSCPFPQHGKRDDTHQIHAGRPQIVDAHGAGARPHGVFRRRQPPTARGFLGFAGVVLVHGTH